MRWPLRVVSAQKHRVWFLDEMSPQDRCLDAEIFFPTPSVAVKKGGSRKGLSGRPKSAVMQRQGQSGSFDLTV